jgi:hypothetical protein
METKKRAPRLKACPTEETEKLLLQVEVEGEEDLEKLSEWLDTPIMECKRGYDLVIDAKDQIMFYKKLAPWISDPDKLRPIPQTTK